MKINLNCYEENRCIHWINYSDFSYGSCSEICFCRFWIYTKNIPAFTTAQDQLDKLSKQWEKEVADGYAVVEQMYKSYQNESVLLSQEMKTKREEAIVAKEKEMKDLQNKYFGVEGDLFKKKRRAR